MSRMTRTDGDATRTAIIEAAGRLFAEQGFAHTTSKAVAQAAKVDTASINYHFGNRDGLYQAVLVEAHRHLMSLEGLEALVATKMSGEDKLRTVFIEVLPRLLDKDSWYGRVLAGAVLSGSASMQSVEMLEIFPKLTVGRQILSEVSGLPADSPLLLSSMLSTMAPLMILFLLGEQLPAPLRAVRELAPEVLANRLADFAIAGLKALHEENTLSA